MSAVMDMLPEILNESAQLRPDSPPLRPRDFANITPLSPLSPDSPTRDATNEHLPAWCVGFGCLDFEEIDLPKTGITPGCIQKEGDCETWQRLDRLLACPVSEVTN
jgi:hypothetical protein